METIKYRGEDIQRVEVVGVVIYSWRNVTLTLLHALYAIIDHRLERNVRPD